MLVNVTVLSASKGPSSSWHRQQTTFPPTNQKHPNLRHALKPPSAASPQSFNHPMILSSADRVRPDPLLLAALRSRTTSPYCCSRREAPTTCRVSETPDNGSPMSERMEDWQGAPDPQRRGKGGLVHVEPAHDPNPIAPAMLEAAWSLGIPIFDDQNGEMMEAKGGAAITNVRIRDGRRLSIFRSYAYPYMNRHNLTVLAHTLVARIVFHGRRAAEVEFLRGGRSHRIAARREIVLSLGAINTPKLLMQSGVGDESELNHAGIDVVQDLPGVGRNLRDHVIVPCVWQYKTPLPMRNSGGEATFFWKSDPSL